MMSKVALSLAALVLLAGPASAQVMKRKTPSAPAATAAKKPTAAKTAKKARGAGKSSRGRRAPVDDGASAGGSAAGGGFRVTVADFDDNDPRAAVATE